MFTSFTVVYRTGGNDNAKWHKSSAYQTREEAEIAKESIERGGRKALVFKTADLEIVGMPEGW